MNSAVICLFLFLMLQIEAHALVFERDQRDDVENAADPEVAGLATSVFTFVLKSKLKRLGDGSFEFTDQTPLKTAVNLCSDERYADDLSAGTRCSGFLVAPTHGITAGHCVIPTQVPDFCANYYIVFDYFRQGDNPPTKLSSNSVRECKRVKKIVFSENAPSDDYAVLRLSAAVLDRKPLRYRKTGKIKDGENIFMLGYPRGMSQKISENRTVINNEDQSFFSTNLDCFHGNSGSPVFNARTHTVEGIFVRGDGFIPNQSSDPKLVGDFFFDSVKGCNKTLVCKKAEGCSAVMNATRITRIQL